MIDFGGVVYYVDIDTFDAVVALKNSEKIITVHERETFDKDKNLIERRVFTTTNDRDREVNTARYEILRTMLEVVVDTGEEFDDSLGIDRALESASLGFKLAFNTLLNYGILKEKEEE